MGDPRSGSAGKSSSGAKQDPRRISFLRWLGELFSNRGKELLALAVLSVVSALAYANWEVFRGRVDDYIIDAAVIELGRDKGRLAAPIEKLVERARKAEVGTLNAGSFFLTPSNRAYTVYIYFPTGHEGKLSYRLTGDTDDKDVVLVLPDGTSHKLNNTEANINLAHYVQQAQGSLESQGIDGIVEPLGALKDVRAITFQLVGPGVDDPNSGGIEVNYISYVAPAIRIEN